MRWWVILTSFRPGSESAQMEPTSPAATDAAPGAVPHDWDARYRDDDIPWDRHSTTHVLDRVLREWQVRPGRALEMGCGTGRNAVHLARLGFEVTAFDLAPRAIKRCRQNAADAGVRVDFRSGDFRVLRDLPAPFPFLCDSGFYHCVREALLPDLHAFLRQVTMPGSLWLTIAGNANDPAAGAKGPPRVQASELCAELEPLFAVVELRETHFEATAPGDSRHPLAWSALLRRR